MIEPNELLAAFPWVKSSNKLDGTESNEIIFNSTKNGWSKQAYVQGFECKTTTLKNVNIFEHIKIAETIYEVIV